MNIASIREYAKKLAEEKFCGAGDIVSFKQDGVVYATKEGAKFEDLCEDDFVEVTDKSEGEYAVLFAVYQKKKEIKALYHVHPAWVDAVSKKGVAIPAVLDDMAQIVGPTCKIAKKKDVRSILRALRGRNSCLLKGEGCVTTGRTMDEAFTCVMVLDKASKCFVAGSVLGGNKIINIFEAKLMQIVYKKKYSKINQEELQKREE